MPMTKYHPAFDDSSMNTLKSLKISWLSGMTCYWYTRNYRYWNGLRLLWTSSGAEAVQNRQLKYPCFHERRSYVHWHCFLLSDLSCKICHHRVPRFYLISEECQIFLDNRAVYKLKRYINTAPVLTTLDLSPSTLSIFLNVNASTKIGRDVPHPS